MVNQDIKKFFRRKKDEESCDIYEDKWVTTKSGRELYYADLLRIAHGESVELNKTIKEITLPTSPNNNNDTKYKYTGKMDMKVGLGPLNELIAYKRASVQLTGVPLGIDFIMSCKNLVLSN